MRKTSVLSKYGGIYEADERLTRRYASDAPLFRSEEGFALRAHLRPVNIYPILDAGVRINTRFLSSSDLQRWSKEKSRDRADRVRRSRPQGE